MIYRPFSFIQSNSSARACACGLAFFDIPISSCSYILLILSISTQFCNEWFIVLLVLASQIHAHVHACADGQFWPHRSIKCLDLYLQHKYQANPMNNNEVIVQWNVHHELFSRYRVFIIFGVLCRGSDKGLEYEGKVSHFLLYYS
jgi:hypothetical protein